MDETHGGIGGVDGLTAGAASAKNLRLDIAHIQLHIDLIHLGEHGDGGGAGVDAPLALRCRHSLHAMHAALVFEAAEGALALDLEGDVLEDAVALLVDIEHLDLPFVGFGIARVQAHQVAGEDASFIAASASANLDDDIFIVARVFWQQQQPQLFQQVGVARFELRDFFAGELAHFGVISRLQQFARVIKLGRSPLILTVSIDNVLQACALFGQLGDAFVIGGDLRIAHQAFQLEVSAFDFRQFFQHV